MDEVRRVAREEAAAMIEPLAEAMWGPKNSTLEGGRDVDRGIAHKVNELYQQSRNGGLPSKITAASFDRRTKIELAIVGGTFTAVTAVVVAVIAG